MKPSMPHKLSGTSVINFMFQAVRMGMLFAVAVNVFQVAVVVWLLLQFPTRFVQGLS
jgi:hypothetical protein